MAKVLEGFGEPLWMLVRLLGISILVGYILAVLGLDPYTMLGGIERLTSSLLAYSLVGFVIVLPVWLIALLLVTPSPTSASCAKQWSFRSIRVAFPSTFVSATPDQIKRLQIITTLTFVLISGAMAVKRALNINHIPFDDLPVSMDHLIGPVSGALAPSIILAPVAYWMLGKIFRRLAVRGPA